MNKPDNRTEERCSSHFSRRAAFGRAAGAGIALASAAALSHSSVSASQL